MRIVICTRCKGTMHWWEAHAEGWCPDCVLEISKDEGEEE